VKKANSGIKALQVVAAKLQDLILLDIMMPDMDGCEVCRRINANPATQAIPVIFGRQKTRWKMMNVALP